MKILKIRLENLNSLRGGWSVDFTDPAYTTEGIFTLAGPTGAGKTTLLDAMCLALYGRTPRLNSISKSANDIMSRGAGDCLAEVEFQTASGQYRSTWTQHRSRNRADGALQNPKHEISAVADGKVLASSLRDSKAKVEELTGMDFDRFSRSMLLAQGGFDAFLKASAKERAPILEDITGTEIYSNISIWVFERARTEKKIPRIAGGGARRPAPAQRRGNRRPAGNPGGTDRGLRSRRCHTHAGRHLPALASNPSQHRENVGKSRSRASGPADPHGRIRPGSRPPRPRRKGGGAPS
jgi:energy-coupling factor transporter ATP-binding protein EcfA2